MQKIIKLIDEILEIAKKNKNQQPIFFDFVKIFYSQNNVLRFFLNYFFNYFFQIEIAAFECFAFLF